MVFTRQDQVLGRTDFRPVAATAALPPLKSVRLLDQVRERIRLLHYSLRTEEAYVYWARAFTPMATQIPPPVATANSPT